MSNLTLLNLEQPERPAMRADYESNAPTGVSLSDIRGMEQFLIGMKTHTGQIVTPEKAKRILGDAQPATAVAELKS